MVQGHLRIVAAGAALGLTLAACGHTDGAGTGTVTPGSSTAAPTSASAPASTQASAGPESVVDDASAGGAAHLFGFSVANPSQLPAIATLAPQVGRVDIINVYIGWTEGFPTATVAAIRAQGAVPMITWEPWDYTKGLNQDTYSLQHIESGQLDAYATTFATDARNSGGPVLLRFAHEMNAGFYPWGIGVDGNTAADYIDAWDHVHAVFAAAHASNVKWVWSPNADGTHILPLATGYPGNNEVDLLGIDGYNPGTEVAGDTWRLPATVLGPSLAALKALAPTKKVIITETGSSNDGGSKAAWVTDLMQLAASTPQVVGVLWSEYVGMADWPLTDDPASLAAMHAALAGAWAAR